MVEWFKVANLLLWNGLEFTIEFGGEPVRITAFREFTVCFGDRFSLSGSMQGALLYKGDRALGVDTNFDIWLGIINEN